MMPALGPRDAVLVVDVQNDFCLGGALAVPRGDEVVPVLNTWMERGLRSGAAVYATRDWHPSNHSSFQPFGGPWPVHCVQNTHGAAFHPLLRLPDTVIVVSKGVQPQDQGYSMFEDTGLAAMLRASGVRRLWVGGLALDYCVRATVLDGIREGFEVHLILHATRPVDVHVGDGERALEQMHEAGAIIEAEDP